MNQKRNASLVWERNMIHVSKPWYVRIGMKNLCIKALIGSCIILGGFLIVDIPLGIMLYDFKQEEYALTHHIINFESTIQKKHTLKKEEQRWVHYKSKMERKDTRHQKTLFDYVFLIYTLADSLVEVQSCVIDKKRVVVTLFADSMEYVFSFFNILSKQITMFSLLGIDSIQYNQVAKKYNATIKGGLVYP